MPLLTPSQGRNGSLLSDPEDTRAAAPENAVFFDPRKSRFRFKKATETAYQARELDAELGSPETAELLGVTGRRLRHLGAHQGSLARQSAQSRPGAGPWHDDRAH